MRGVLGVYIVIVLWVLIEGIESESGGQCFARELLKEFSCVYIRGMVWVRPVPVSILSCIGSMSRSLTRQSLISWSWTHRKANPRL